MSKMGFIAGSKWIKHRLVSRSAMLRDYLPDTELYSEATLHQFLSRYQVVFIKPEYGGGGRRVFQIVRLPSGSYRVKMERQERIVPSLSAAHAWVEQVRKGKSFLIQKGIDLAKWKHRPVDLRTILQRNEQNQWEVSGMFGKSAGRHLAVTNVCIGGRAHSVESYLRGIGYSEAQTAEIIQRLKDMSLQIARQFDEFANAIYGLDIGLDRNGKLWLIEVNTVPSIDIFLKIELPDMYARSKKLWNLNRSINLAAKHVALSKRLQAEKRCARAHPAHRRKKQLRSAHGAKIEPKQGKVR